jgi:hypothetical protein
VVQEDSPYVSAPKQLQPPTEIPVSSPAITQLQAPACDPGGSLPTITITATARAALTEIPPLQASSSSVTNPNGSTTVNNPDGTTTITFPDGTVTTTNPWFGSKNIKKSDGTTIDPFPNGTEFTSNTSNRFIILIGITYYSDTNIRKDLKRGHVYGTN